MPQYDQTSLSQNQKQCHLRVRTKILEKYILERENHLNHFSCNISHNYENEVNNKLSKFRNDVKQHTQCLKTKQTEMRLRFSKVMAIPVY